MPNCSKCGRQVEMADASCAGCRAQGATSSSPVQPDGMSPFPPTPLGHSSLFQAPPPRPKPRNRYVIIVFVCVGIILGLEVLLPTVMGPMLLRDRGQSVLARCKDNLKNLGTALEMYATDHGGRYPTSLQRVLPAYLKVLPTCPTVGQSYDCGFQSHHHDSPRVGRDSRHDKAVDRFTIVCAGSQHGGVGQGDNFPQYTSGQGLIAQ